MFIFCFGVLSVIAGSGLIEILVKYDARDPTIFVSGFWFGSFCGAILAMYFVSKRERP